MAVATVDREFLSPRECGQILGARVEFIHAEIREGRLAAADISRPGAKLRRFKVRRSDFEAYIAERSTCASRPVKSPRRPKLKASRQWV